jgi:asparaginyl-tRNA synthetase
VPQKVYIDSLSDSDGQEVKLEGWLYNARSSGKIRFLLVRDGTGIVQCIASIADVGEKAFALIDTLTQETSLRVSGIVHKDDRAPGGYEIQLRTLEILGRSLDYPITPKEHSDAFLLDHRHLWLRSKRQHAIMRIRHEATYAIRDYFDASGFTLIDAPIFTPSACEGTTTLFETNYFKTKAYLSQSGQLYNEAAASAFGKVYCFGPTFRAEKSKTRRHLTEFWQVEPEVAFLEFDGLMELAEDFTCHVVARILDRKKEELKTLERDISVLENVVSPFPRISYADAVEMLRKIGFDIDFGADFGAPEETAIAEHFDRPVFVHRYPKEIKAFYMKTDPEDPRVVLGTDLLAPEGYGEIIGASQREDDLETLIEKIKAHDLPLEDFEWYLDIRRYGAVPMSGFGLGLERFVSWICKLKHLREAIPFPRMMYRLSP